MNTFRNQLVILACDTLHSGIIGNFERL